MVLPPTLARVGDSVMLELCLVLRVLDVLDGSIGEYCDEYVDDGGSAWRDSLLVVVTGVKKCGSQEPTDGSA